ncbi:hypothetical protein ACN4EG_05710 [Alkalinema pantanalense CENA528]|uniref:hypothetical protein n=1 Tax=Alkalinema pantanalense TaxID=1620705 RepID=UPI003D6EAEB4
MTQDLPPSSHPSGSDGVTHPSNAIVQPNLADQSIDPSQKAVDTFRISPLIRGTLLSLYAALTIPLPFLAELTQAPVPATWLWVGLGLGAIALYGALSERVVVDAQGVQVTYPAWVPPVFRKGWQLAWGEIAALKPRSTGQGGLVYYFVTRSGEGFLLPMRIVGFARFVRRVQAETGIDTRDVKPLSQPWMYVILLVFTLFLLLIDVWTIGIAMGGQY